MSELEFYPADAPAPERLETDAFIVRFITPEDSDMDYEALMRATPYYREFNPRDWRDLTFTSEENYEEMERHQEDNLARREFTYTITTPDGTSSYGCVYMHSLLNLLKAGGAPQEEIDHAGPHECQVHLWVTPDAIDKDLDTALITALIDWMGKLAFRRWVFQADSADKRLCGQLESAGLVKTHALKDGRWSLYAPA